jgi:uncharacterized protein YbjT (DUF2867 family)
MSTILVTGGTGTLGRALVPRLTEAGHTVRILSRRPRPPSAQPAGWATGDLRRDEGLDQALDGIDVIVHCASAPRGDPVAGQNLIAAARRTAGPRDGRATDSQSAGPREATAPPGPTGPHGATGPHLVYISIVGIDQVPMGYYRAKLATERLVEESGLPWTILRATQFHDLILRGCELLARPPVMLVPARVRFQPVSTGEVAVRLASLSGQPPAGRAPDMGGPQARTARDLARSYLTATGRRRRVVQVGLPGAAFAGLRRGGNLAPEHATGTVTFEEFLTERFGSRRPQ